MMPRLSVTAVTLACSSFAFAAVPATAPSTGAPADVSVTAQAGDQHEAAPLPAGVISPAVKKEKCCFMGVSTSPLHAEARAQLDVPPGVGLVVDFVDPESPADKAGVKEHDVIQKLDDQWVINPQQLSVLVRLHKAGEIVTLKVLRKGKPEEVKVTLGEKLLPALDRAAEMALILQPGQAVQGLPGLPPEILNKLRAMPGARASSSITSSDGEHTVSVNITDGKKTATIRDKAGNTLFDGPIDTDQDRAKIPDAVRPKLEKLEAGLTPEPTPRELPGAEPK